MAKFVRHTACDRCPSSDAKAEYSDGSSYCFSCGWSSGRSKDSFNATQAFEYEEEHKIFLPKGFERAFPKEVLDFLAPTTITLEELYGFNYTYQKTGRRLGRLFTTLRNRNCDGVLQGDLWNNSKYVLCGFETKCIDPVPKTVSYSAPRQMDNILPYVKGQFYGPKNEISGASSKANNNPLQHACILVEDSLSAIRVGRHCASYTLFGSSIDNKKLSWLIAPYKKVFVWLDADKWNYSKQLSERIKILGKQSVSIYSELDPKYVEDEIILSKISD